MDYFKLFFCLALEFLHVKVILAKFMKVLVFEPQNAVNILFVKFISATFQTIPVLSEVELVLWSAASVREWCR